MLFDAATRDAVKAYQKKHDLPWTGTLDQPTWASLVPGKVTSDVTAGMTVAEAADHGAARYTAPLPERTTGKAVSVLQLALGMKRVDRNGYLGAVTVAAVKVLKRFTWASRSEPPTQDMVGFCQAVCNCSHAVP